MDEETSISNLDHCDIQLGLPRFRTHSIMPFMLNNSPSSPHPSSAHPPPTSHYSCPFFPLSHRIVPNYQESLFSVHHSAPSFAPSPHDRFPSPPQICCMSFGMCVTATCIDLCSLIYMNATLIAIRLRFDCTSGHSHSSLVPILF